MQRSLAHRCAIIAAVSLFLFFTCSFNLNVAMAFQPLKGDMASFIPGKSDTPATGDTISSTLSADRRPVQENGSIFPWPGLSMTSTPRAGFWLTGRRKKSRSSKAIRRLNPTSPKRSSKDSFWKIRSMSWWEQREHILLLLPK